MRECTILILTYKGKHHLEWLLPTVKEAMESYRGDAKVDVLIVDNGCDEPTRQFVWENFPGFVYEFSPVNDYLFSLNDYIKRLASGYMLLLNDDMRLHPDILNIVLPLIIANPSYFAVTCNVLDWEGTTPTNGIREMSSNKGLLTHYWKDYAFDNGQLYFTLYPAGGAALFDIEKFNDVGGFDPLFRPAYCEDADVGINAWYKGWPTVFCPSAMIYHREGGTINGQFAVSGLSRLQARNLVKWSIKNNRRPFSIAFFLLMLPYRLTYNLFTNRTFALALLDAVKELPGIIKKRGRPNPRISTSQLETLLKTRFIVDHGKGDHIRERAPVL